MASKIKSAREYHLRYKQYEGLPSLPEKYYKNFPGWPKFLGKEK
jgi:hypothetical protein